MLGTFEHSESASFVLTLASCLRLLYGCFDTVACSLYCCPSSALVFIDFTWLS